MTNEERSVFGLPVVDPYRNTARSGMVGKISMVVVCLLMASARGAEARPQEQTSKPIVHEAVTPHVYEQGIRSMTQVRAYKSGDPVKVIEDLREAGEKEQGTKSGAVTPKTANVDLSKMPKAKVYHPGDPIRVVPDLKESAAPAAASPMLGPSNVFPVGASFDGIPATGFLPPDVAGAVGPDHYILMVNVAFAIYDKQGNLLVGPSPINALWSGFGGPCSTNNNGDPIVRYDHLADRWLMSQFALPGGAAGLHECVAISRTADPVAGGWFLYDFPMQDATGAFVFPDYPKIGVWPDGYYMGTQRGFPGGGLDVWSFEREKMLVGAAARTVHFFVSPPSLFLLPADVDGPAPPTGSPEFYGRQIDGARFGGASRFEVFAFHVDWSNPAFSTFGMIASLPTAPFSSKICQASFLEPCIPQPGTAVELEALSVWTMWRLQYRNFGSHETLMTNHTVNAGGVQAGVRWYELRRPPAGSWSIFQQGTYSPDKTTSRWMGSVAMNKSGEVALGYSASSGGSVFPSIRYAARLASDSPGTLGTEVNLMSGGGSQLFGIPRWGNYTTMDVDPKDDCTFWYAGEYMPSTSPAGWRTHISSFRSASCGGTTQYMYPAKIVCGLQKKHEDVQLARGFYATNINIHNPNDVSVTFTKKLALTIPPGDQTPGKVIPIAKDTLGPDEALEVDCADIEHRLFPKGLPGPYIEGFVVIESQESLDVTTVFTTAALDDDGRAVHQSGIEVQQVHERMIKKP
jgi:hypothetical protein